MGVKFNLILVPTSQFDPKCFPLPPFARDIVWHSQSLHCSPSRGDVYVSQFVGSVCRSCGGKRNEYVRWVCSVDSSRFVPDPSGRCSWVCWMLLAHCHRLSAQKFHSGLTYQVPCIPSHTNTILNNTLIFILTYLFMPWCFVYKILQAL